MNHKELSSKEGRTKFFNMNRFEDGKRVPMKRLRKMYYAALNPASLKLADPDLFEKLEKQMPEAIADGMRSTAEGRWLRSGARKMNAVMHLVRGKSVAEALRILQFTNKKAARQLEKVLGNAAAGAENEADFDSDRLYIAGCVVEQGPTIPRVRPMSMGRVGRIRKRTCYARVDLKERPEAKPVAKKPASKPASKVAKTKSSAAPRKGEK